MKDETKGIAGHEGAGVVVAVGENMRHKWKNGDRCVVQLFPTSTVEILTPWAELASNGCGQRVENANSAWVLILGMLCQSLIWNAQLNGIDELHCPKQINAGFTTQGTFSQYCVSDGRYTTRIPEGVKDEEAG
jgi:alcohol dehydrogenase, propanol-preferring